MAELSRFTTCQLALNGNLRGVVKNEGHDRKIFVCALRTYPLLLQILDLSPPPHDVKCYLHHLERLIVHNIDYNH